MKSVLVHRYEGSEHLGCCAIRATPEDVAALVDRCRVLGRRRGLDYEISPSEDDPRVLPPVEQQKAALIEKFGVHS